MQEQTEQLKHHEEYKVGVWMCLDVVKASVHLAGGVNCSSQPQMTNYLDE